MITTQATLPIMVKCSVTRSSEIFSRLSFEVRLAAKFIGVDAVCNASMPYLRTGDRMW